MHKPHMSAKGPINGVIAGIIFWGIIIAAILWLTGCTMMSKQPELYPCVSEPRPLKDVNVSIKYASLLTTDWHCRQQIKEVGGKAVPILLGFYHSCATLPCDASVPEGEKPYCKVVFPYGTEEGSELWNHEMKHCQGYGH